jgi:hypothetical protein
MDEHIDHDRLPNGILDRHHHRGVGRRCIGKERNDVSGHGQRNRQYRRIA